MSGVRDRVLARLATPEDLGPERMAAVLAEEAPLLSEQAFHRALDDLHAYVHGLGPIARFADDPLVNDILINGDGSVWLERSGTLCPTETHLDRFEVLTLIERVLGPLGKTVDQAHPICDARLPDGSRVCVVLEPLSVDGPSVAIRRFSVQRRSVSDFCTPDLEPLLTHAVRQRANLLVFGGTGSGKTTLLNALCASIPVHQRLVTVEDAAELQLPHPHVVRLETRTANAEGVGSLTIRQLLATSLRLRPDRIVVGEVRGEEAIDMLWAMSSGHEGSLSTLHANSATDALLRVESFALMGTKQLPLEVIRAQIASAVDLLIGVRRNERGQRLVFSIDEVGDAESSTRLRPLVRDGELIDLPARPWATERKGGS